MTAKNATDLGHLLEDAGAEGVELHYARPANDWSVMAFLPGGIQGQIFSDDADLALCRSKLGYLVSLMGMQEPEGGQDAPGGGTRN